MKVYNLFLFIGLAAIYSCSSTKNKPTADTKMVFLDEYIFPNKIMLNNTEIGGLSGIDSYEDKYVLVCDDSKNPRFYMADVQINNTLIDTVIFQKVVEFSLDDPFMETTFFDLESVLYREVSEELLFSSEGNIKDKRDPSLFKTTAEGSFVNSYSIPSYFYAESEQGPRHNGTFEGLARSFNNDGFWVATELPLKKDGEEPKTTETYSPVRITYYNWENENPQRQFIYQLDKIDKRPKGDFAVNGVSEIFMVSTEKMLVLERSYSSGWGKKANGLKIYEINITNAENSLEKENLSEEKIETVEKKLVFDLASLRKKLTSKSIDNIEGICFGPTLENGHKTVLLISDNNFNKLDPQVNQFLLFEILE
ncbi:esterase-like activity of phytase family protein [Galbibacter mesophilus]|uniref:esterase-like activity of phytase family protein n=1 Tax=Galbibacter mesophilus TaxID=379069 RepID=UPI00191E44A9|nr:esterase-like activity of phytase family protein [Galbibacter mesophilus]MCM5662252.1 esterase-like activity of phytase family protein [Galbibacter mesophilus]